MLRYSLARLGGILMVVALLATVAHAGDVTDTYSGKVLSTSRVQLIVEMHDGTQKSFVIAPETKVKLDGEDAAVQDLRMGYLVKVTAKDIGDQLVAAAVEANKVEALPSGATLR